MQQRIVITGSSKGIGFGLATYFLKQGHKVVISGSTEKSTLEAKQKLYQEFGSAVEGVPCDVTEYIEVLNLCTKASEILGGIDIWINNAGISQLSCPAHLMPLEEVRRIVDINLFGVIHGSKIAINYMLKQGHGALYNMEGLGSDGRIAKNLGYYGMSKYAVRYLTKVYTEELKDTLLIIGRLSPGMVTTDLLMKDIEKTSDPVKTRKIFSILADKVSDVTPYLGKRVLENKKSGVLIAWLTTPKILFRFLTAGMIKRNPFS